MYSSAVFLLLILTCSRTSQLFALSSKLRGHCWANTFHAASLPVLTCYTEGGDRTTVKLLLLCSDLYWFWLSLLFVLFLGQTRFLLQMGIPVLRREILDPFWPMKFSFALWGFLGSVVGEVLFCVGFCCCGGFLCDFFPPPRLLLKVIFRHSLDRLCPR